MTLGTTWGSSGAQNAVKLYWLPFFAPTPESERRCWDFSSKSDGAVDDNSWGQNADYTQLGLPLKVMLKIGPRNLETSVNHTVLESSLILGCGAGSM